MDIIPTSIAVAQALKKVVGVHHVCFRSILFLVNGHGLEEELLRLKEMKQKVTKFLSFQY